MASPVGGVWHNGVFQCGGGVVPAAAGNGLNYQVDATCETGKRVFVTSMCGRV